MFMPMFMTLKVRKKLLTTRKKTLVPDLDTSMLEVLVRLWLSLVYGCQTCRKLNAHRLQYPSNNSLKCSQYKKNDAIQLKNFVILKLPPFFVTYTVKEKRRQFQTLENFQLSSVVLILTVL